MRDFHLRFFSHERWPDGMMSLESELNELRKVPGCYVLGSADGTDFVYPWGTSPIFYIGKSSTLRGRLSAHRKWIRKAEDDHHRFHFAPLHQYGAAFGTDIAYYRKITNQSLDKLESNIIVQFYNIYGSIPVANRAWPKSMRKPLGIEVT